MYEPRPSRTQTQCTYVRTVSIECMLVCKGLKLEGRSLFHGLGKSKTYMEKEVYQKFNTCYM